MLRGGFVDRRVVLAPAAARVLDVGSAGDAVADAGRHQHHEALAHEIASVVRIPDARHLDEVLGLGGAAVVQDEEGRSGDGVIAEYRQLDRVGDGLAARVSGGHCKLDDLLLQDRARRQ